MKRHSVFYFISILFLLFTKSQIGFAQTEGAPAPTFFKPFAIGVLLENYRYAEPGLITHSGFLVGLRGVASWAHSDLNSDLSSTSGTFLSRFSSSILGDLATGTLNYDGALCDVNTNVCTPYKAKTYDILLRLTYRFEYLISEKMQIFIGPGFRYILDQGQGSGFYTRMGTYLFLPAGFTYYFKDYNFEFEYDFFLQGKMNSKLSEVNSTYGDITHSQPQGRAYKVTVSRFFENLGVRPLNFSIYYEKREVESSGLEQLRVNQQPSGIFFREPKNFTEVLGVRASFLY